MRNLFLTVILSAMTVACAETEQSTNASAPSVESATVQDLVDTAERIENSTGWFEILKLPNDVYALWEPGHVEKVNSFFVLGSDRDLLYDTGMGIARISQAIDDLRKQENLPTKPIIVVNSHNHLDHNGGNQEFAEIWTVNEPWAIRRLTSGVPGGEEGGFVSYWNQLREHEGVQPPDNFSPDTHAIPPYPEDQIRFLDDNEKVDLGDRQFAVIRTFSHSPDGIALYDSQEKLFFGGDTFYGPEYLITDINLLAADLKRIETLPIEWHYASHGAQLITAMQQGKHLAAVSRMINGEGETGSTTFAGFEIPMQQLDGVAVLVAPELLLY